MAATDTISEHLVAAPARNAASVTPNDSTDLTDVTRAVYVGTSGDLEVNMADSGSAVVIPDVPAGAFLPIRVSRILNTNTTATGIVAFW